MNYPHEKLPTPCAYWCDERVKARHNDMRSIAKNIVQHYQDDLEQDHAFMLNNKHTNAFVWIPRTHGTNLVPLTPLGKKWADAFLTQDLGHNSDHAYRVTPDGVTLTDKTVLLQEVRRLPNPQYVVYDQQNHCLAAERDWVKARKYEQQQSVRVFEWHTGVLLLDTIPRA